MRSRALTRDARGRVDALKVCALLALTVVDRAFAEPESSTLTSSAHRTQIDDSTSLRVAPLRLEDALRAALRAHPDARVFDLQIEEARAQVLAARGNFDLTLKAQGSHAPLGYYERTRGALELSQPTTLYGAELRAKYENGLGFPVYDGGLVTSAGGKVSLGVLLPLLRGGVTDARRLERAQALLNEEVREVERTAGRAQLIAKAGASWWKWAVLGQKVEIYRGLLRLSVDREGFVRDQVDEGALPPIELVDNTRLVASRKAGLTRLELELQVAALELGLYHRADDGAPDPPSAERLPAFPTRVSPLTDRQRQGVWQDLDKAPELQVYKKSVELLDQEVRFARNQVLPRVDLEVVGSQSFGEERAYSAYDRSRTETAAFGQLTFELDLQQRKARGRLRVAEAKRDIVNEKLRLAQDTLKLAVRARLDTLEAEAETARLSHEATGFARELAAAERERFVVGQSSILAVNLREEAVLGARLAELDAILAFELAYLELQQLLGRQELSAYAAVRSP